MKNIHLCLLELDERGTAAMGLIEACEVAYPYETRKIRHLQKQHGPDSYVFEYSFKQNAPYLTPFPEYLNRVWRYRNKVDKSGWLTIEIFPSREFAMKEAEWMSRWFRKRTVAFHRQREKTRKKPRNKKQIGKARRNKFTKKGGR